MKRAEPPQTRHGRGATGHIWCQNGQPNPLTIHLFLRTMQPTHIGRYEVVRVLGQGAMGVVFEAIDPRLARRVAIKTIRVESLDGHQAMAYESRFETEARAVARLAHPNIVTVYDSGQMDGQSYLVLEFVAGVNLKQCLRAGVRFTPKGAVALVQGVLAGLAQAHGQRIIHRDIKPENVLLDAMGQVKLTDFGIAKMLDAEVDNGTQLSGGSIGTPRYMSPEQVRGLPLDARSDVFSAAVLLYELLTGMQPFDGGSAIAIATAILHDDPPSPSSVAPGIPPGLDAVLAQALSKTVHMRPESAQALSEAIAAVEWPDADAVVDPSVTQATLGWPGAWAGLLALESPARLAVLFREVGLDLGVSSPTLGLSPAVQIPDSPSTQGRVPPADDRTRVYSTDRDEVLFPSEPSDGGRSGAGLVVGDSAASEATQRSKKAFNFLRWVVLWVGFLLLIWAGWWWTRPATTPVPVAEPIAAPPPITDAAQSLAENEKLMPHSPAQSVEAVATPVASAAALQVVAPSKPVDSSLPAKAKSPVPVAEKPAASQPVAGTAQPVLPAASKPVDVSPPQLAAAPPPTPSSGASTEPCPGMGFFEREACLWKQCSTSMFREHAACARFQNKPLSSP